MNSRNLFELIGTADEQMLEHSERTAPKRKHNFNGKKILLLAAAVIAAFAVTATAAAVTGGTNTLNLILGANSQDEPDEVPATDEAITEETTPLDMILEAFPDGNPNVIQAQLDYGEWVYLNGESIAVIVPEIPVKIMLSRDGGTTWRESTVLGSDKMYAFGSMRDEVQYGGGFIGFFDETGGYLVLTADVAMNNQPMRIYLTSDGGDTWTEIGNPYDVHVSVLTGAGFSTPEIGFISYRYYADQGPDIWWTSDGGDTWQKLTVDIPEAYKDCSFMPQSPTFEGAEGIYPIDALHDGEGETIYMYSDDYGMTWEFR